MSQEDITEVRSLGATMEEGRSPFLDGSRAPAAMGRSASSLVYGTAPGLVQGVLLKKELPEDTWALLETLTQECSVALTGEVREEARAPGGYELGVTGLEVTGGFGGVPDPAQGARGRVPPGSTAISGFGPAIQRAGLRVRHEVEQAIHDFFYDRDFVRIDTPILTGAIGESAGTLFETDYFGEPAFLAQTGQLYVETACPAFRKVYCFGPTFRAEKSKTRRHLTEFWMLEPEVAFADSDDNMRLQEDLVCYLVERALDRCSPMSLRFWSGTPRTWRPSLGPSPASPTRMPWRFYGRREARSSGVATWGRRTKCC